MNVLKITRVNPEEEISTFTRIVVPDGTESAYEFIREKIMELFPDLENFKLNWIDNDGDCITFSSNEELQQAMKEMNNGALKIYVNEICDKKAHRVASPEKIQRRGKKVSLPMKKLDHAKEFDQDTRQKQDDIQKIKESPTACSVRGRNRHQRRQRFLANEDVIEGEKCLPISNSDSEDENPTNKGGRWRRFRRDPDQYEKRDLSEDDNSPDEWFFCPGGRPRHGRRNWRQSMRNMQRNDGFGFGRQHWLIFNRALKPWGYNCTSENREMMTKDDCNVDTCTGNKFPKSTITIQEDVQVNASSDKDHGREVSKGHRGRFRRMYGFGHTSTSHHDTPEEKPQIPCRRGNWRRWMSHIVKERTTVSDSEVKNSDSNGDEDIFGFRRGMTDRRLRGRQMPLYTGLSIIPGYPSGKGFYRRMRDDAVENDMSCPETDKEIETLKQRDVSFGSCQHRRARCFRRKMRDDSNANDNDDRRPEGRMKGKPMFSAKKSHVSEVQQPLAKETGDGLKEENPTKSNNRRLWRRAFRRRVLRQMRRNGRIHGPGFGNRGTVICRPSSPRFIYVARTHEKKPLLMNRPWKQVRMMEKMQRKMMKLEMEKNMTWQKLLNMVRDEQRPGMMGNWMMKGARFGGFGRRVMGRHFCRRNAIYNTM